MIERSNRREQERREAELERRQSRLCYRVCRCCTKEMPVHFELIPVVDKT
jgi:hypothetical protein